MTKPILYYIPYAPPSRSTALAVKAVNLDVEYKILNVMGGEHLTPEFLKLNPQHTVPTFYDNGFVVWDSHAIISYIAEKYDKTGSLYPNDIKTRATINQRLHYESSVLTSKSSAIVRPVFRGTAKEFPEEAIKEYGAVHDLLEIFVKDGYMVGDKLTVADFAFIAILSGMVGIVPPDTTKHTKLLKWIERISKLPYYEEANGKYVNEMHDKIFAKLNQNRNE